MAGMALTIRERVPLAPHTTFKLGGSAKFFTTPHSVLEFKSALKFADQHALPLFILGGGSDVLVNDSGFSGLVIHPSNHGIEIYKKTKKHTYLRIGAGTNWDKVVAFSVKHNLQGIECLSGIPGTAGAAPIQNIGAYGQSLSDTLVSVKVIELETQKLHQITKKICRFGYRDSIFKQTGKYLIININLKLNNNTKTNPQYQSLTQYLQQHKIYNPSLSQIRKAVLTIRSQKLPDHKTIGNAGSFFKNPFVTTQQFKKLQKVFPDIPFFNQTNNQVKLYAGWLVEQTGWKGKKYKQVGVYDKNALVLINPNFQGTAKTIKQLAQKISDSVQHKFGITLEREVQYI